MMNFTQHVSLRKKNRSKNWLPNCLCPPPQGKKQKGTKKQIMFRLPLLLQQCIYHPLIGLTVSSHPLLYFVKLRPCLVPIFFWKIDTVALSFVFDKYCPIMH